MNQATKNTPKLPKLMLVIVALFILGLVALFYSKKKSGTQVTYRKVQLQRGAISVTVLSTGVVQPENRLEIKPPIAGRVEEVLIKEGQLVKKGQLLAWMSSTERAAMLDAARAKGGEELRRWEELYRPTPILAPINGTVILRNVEAGQTFTNQESVFVMSDRLTVKAQVDETDISKIKLGQEAKIVLDAYSEQTIPARVDQIAFEAKTVNNVTTYVVDVLPKVAPDFMRSGMTANVTFLLSNKEDVAFLPTEAIRFQDGKTVVLVEASKGQPVERLITIGQTDGKKTEVLSGVSEGEVVLAAQLSQGTKNPAGRNPFAPMGPGRGGGRSR